MSHRPCAHFYVDGSFDGLQDVAVEVIERQFSAASNPASNPASKAKRTQVSLGYTFEDGYFARPGLGTSLSLSGLSGAASLGGYLRVTIKSPSQTVEKYVALTSHHALSGMYHEFFLAKIPSLI